MKKIILYLSLVFVLVLQFNIDIFADNLPVVDMITVSDLPSNVIDSNGYVIGGSVFWGQSNAIEYPNVQTCFSYVMPDQGGSLKCIYGVYDPNKNIYRNKYTFKFVNNTGYSSYRNYQKWFTYNELSDAYSNDQVEELLLETVSPSNYTDPRNGDLSTDNECITNIPLFSYDDTNGISNYINNGDISSALNKNDVKPLPVLPQPYFDKINGLDDSSKRQRIANGFSSNLIFKWNTGNNNSYTYENMGYEGTLSLVVNYLDSGTLTSETVTENVSFTAYEGNSPYYIFNSDVLNKKLFTLFGVDFFGSLGGRIVKATFQIRNVDKTNHDNKSAPVYYAYNFIDGTSGTNNDSNNNADSTEESTEDITYNPNTNQSGNGEVPSNSSSSSSATANGVVVNVTQNNTNGKSSIWDTVINGINLLLNVLNNKIGGILDKFTDFIGGLANITDTSGLLSKLLESLSTLLVGTSSSGGTSGGVSGGIGGLAGAIESITGSINNLISGVLTPFTDAITSLMDSVSDLLSASSELGQYISSGFGLLGENGYIAMFGSFFQFVPTEIWSLIKLAVGSSCSVLLSGSIVKLLRRY